MTSSYPARITALVPAATSPGAGTGQHITRPLTSGFLLIASRPGTPPPGQGGQPAPPRWPEDRSGMWLRNAAAGLCVLAAAAAAVSFTAQFRMVDATRHLALVAALEAAIPDTAALVFACLGVALALHGRRALRARALNLAAVGASVFMNAIAAAPGWRNLAIWAMPPIAYALASDTLIGVVRARALARHRDLACRPGRRTGHAPGHRRRADLVAAAPDPGSRVHRVRVPRLGPGRVPGRPRPPRRPPRAGAGSSPPGPGEGDASEEGDQDRPLPFPSYRTKRRTRHGPARPCRGDLGRPCPPCWPAPRRCPRRPAQSRPRREERRPPMMIKLAVALVIVIALAAFLAWAFLPARYLPGNRARHLRIRLHLRLHPGKGFAHVFTLWLRWSRLAVLRRSGRIRRLASAAAPDRRPPPALGVPRPRPLPPRPAHPAGRAPARHGAASHL